MSHSSKFELKEVIHGSGRNVVYRARSEEHGRDVVLKIINQEFPSPAEVARLRHEARILERLNAPGFPKCLGVREEENKVFLVFEDEGKITSLSKLMVRDGMQENPDTVWVLEMAVKFCDILARMHSAGVIHKDVKPSNIALNEGTGEFMLLDFGISTELSFEVREASEVDVLEGSLPYISPEQTGRMNRVVDYRTDFYSFGVTLYELLTGMLPFEVDDVVGMIHAHLSRPAVPPHERRASVPPMVSKVIMKLLAKNAEDRYQSAGGLKHDLGHCLSELKTTGAIAEFELGCRDVSSQFRIPQKLYGREKELDLLLEAYYKSVSHRSELLLVTGYSGIGKSSLTHELHRPVAADKGFFISGKFDQFKRNIPYSALGNAFTELAQSLLMLGEVELTAWRTRLQRAVGSNGKLILELAPELEMVIGPQPPVEDIEPAQAQARFARVLESFVGEIAGPHSPLVIFLDDLQWADGPTLAMLGILLSNPNFRGLLIVGAYRDNEVGADHPLLTTFSEIRGSGASITTLILAPLPLDRVENLVADALRLNESDSRELASLVMTKTSGNPFFVSQFLEALVREELVFFSFEKSRWEWDIDGIRNANITENVVDLMLGQLRKMPESTQYLAKIAACVGNSITLRTLSSVTMRSPAELARELWPAAAAGLLLPSGEGMKLLASSEGAEELQDAELAKLGFRFLHDRVQQAAYSIISADEREGVHLQVGSRLLADATPAERKERLFDIVSHLNIARSLLKEPFSIVELAELNLEAGRRARESVAFGPMLEYMTVAAECVDRAGADVSDPLAEEVYLGCAEANDFNRRFEVVEEYLVKASRHSTGVLGELKASKIRFHAVAAQGRAKEGFVDSLRSIRDAGIYIPYNAKNFDIIRTFIEMKVRLAFVDLNRIENKPELKDPVKLSALEFCVLMTPPASNSVPLVFPLLLMTLLRSLLKDGPSASGALGLVGFSMLHAKIGDYRSARRYDEVSKKLVEKYSGPKSIVYAEAGKTYFARMMWTPFRDLANHFRTTTIHYAYEAGNLEMVVCSLLYPVSMDFLAGESLNVLAAQIPELNAQADKYHQETMHNAIRPYLQIVDCLANPDWNGELLSGIYYDEATMLPSLESSQDYIGVAFSLVCSAYVDILFGREEAVLTKAKKAKKLVPLLPLTPFNPMIFYLSALAQIAKFRSSDGKDNKAISEAKRDLKQLRNFAKVAPFNFEPQYLVAQAEFLSVRGKPNEADLAYDRAAASAQKHGNVRDAALASELYARYLFRMNRQDEASRQIRRAYFHYEKWGAKPKIRQLETLYPETLNSPSGETFGSSSTSYGSSTTETRSIDLRSVMKASGIIAGDIELDKLLSNMMKVVAENAGAEKVVFVLSEEGNGSLLVQACWDQSGRTEVMQAAALDASAEVPASMVRYVARSRETVLLGNASKSAEFSRDEYVRSHQPKSVLAMPILSQGKLLGVLYLENNQAQDAFTPSRLEVLTMLCSQIAVSLNHALLYASLEQKVRERTEELEEQRANSVHNAKMAALGEMAGGIAHEINNPLAVIDMSMSRMVKYLNKDPIDREVTIGIANKTSQTVARIAKIITGLRSFSREGANDPVAVTSLEQIADDTLAFCQQKFTESGVRFEYEPLPDAHVVCRPVQISQTILTLLNNAYDAISKNEGERWIRLEMQKDGQNARVIVSDCGSGIPEALQEKIFQPFFTTKDVGSGTGLGLSIAKGLIEMNGGTLTLDTQAANTRFVITLPLAAADEGSEPLVLKAG